MINFIINILLYLYNKSYFNIINYFFSHDYNYGIKIINRIIVLFKILTFYKFIYFNIF